MKIFWEYVIGGSIFLLIMAIYVRWVGHTVVTDNWLMFIVPYVLFWVILYIITKDKKGGKNE